ncbi:RNA dependent RNA polymerase-domain-containing protein [Lactifluus subvellereus]|nr:RNA dependent RNA polymerase-domain-containing protein [Lactifluus subvellereus]
MFPLDEIDVNLAHGRSLNATFHDNESVYSLDSSSSEKEDTAHENLETHRDTSSSRDRMAALTPQRPSGSGHGVSRASDHRIAQPGVRNQRLAPLKLPAVFRNPDPTTPRSVIARPSHDKVQRQVVQSQVSTPTSLPAPRSVDRQERHHPSDSPSAHPVDRSRTSLSVPIYVAALPSNNLDAFSYTDVAPPPPALSPLRGKLALPRRILCHSPAVQRQMERLKISWGVQYELARGVLAERWTWAHITESVLGRLQGSNAKAAPEVPLVVLEAKDGRPTVPRTNSGVTSSALWEEYDREQDAINERQSRGLGIKDEREGVQDWYGGRIQQVLRLSRPTKNEFKYRLDQPVMQRSNRFARFLGSRRILQVRLSKELRFAKDQAALEHLSSPFVLCGRVFVPFASKEGSVYMMEVNEDEDRDPDNSQGDDTRISLWDFIEWHNPLTLNQNQPLNKWLTRFDLGLSTSVPVLRFKPSNIDSSRTCVFMNGFLLEAIHEQGILTDGCGFINGAALTLIARRLCLPSRPTAVQGRVAGSKGLWVLHPEDRSPTEPPRIWIRDSQRKIKLDTLREDSAHVIFDLIDQSGRITNGVDTHVFEGLLTEGLSNAFTSLTQWDGDGAMPLLWSAVDNLGNVTRTRLQNVTRGLARAIDDPGDEDSDLDSTDKSLHQTVLELAMDRYFKKYHLEVPQSAEAFIIPDPFGVLEEGQIQFKSSRELKDPLTETNVYVIRGPVLLSRNPTMVASDIQKVEAVEHERLADYLNVIVFSTKGSRSLASLLAGGDKAIVNWEPSIVEQFVPPQVVDKPGDLEEQYFEEHVESVTSFHSHLARSIPDKAHKLFLRAVLRSLEDGNVGKYSRFHAYAAYTKGYSHPDTIRLAYMFTTCLDSRKTGHRVRRRVFEEDSKQFGWPLPDCLRDSVDGAMDEVHQNIVIKRGEGLAPFVLDALRHFGEGIAENFLSKYEESSGQGRVVSRSTSQDHALIKPYKRISEKLSEMESLLQVNVKDFVREARRELKMVEDHVKTMQKEWPRACYPQKASKKVSAPAKNRGVTALQREFVSGPEVPHLSLLGDVPAIRASYAYTLCKPENPKFAFAMASEALCHIKAQELGGTTLGREFAELMAIPKSTARTLSALRASM